MKRYDFDDIGGNYVCPEGEWVRYEDARKIVNLAYKKGFYFGKKFTEGLHSVGCSVVGLPVDPGHDWNEED
jgi:hypothetical protein